MPKGKTCRHDSPEGPDFMTNTRIVSMEYQLEEEDCPPVTYRLTYDNIVHLCLKLDKELRDKGIKMY
jgi:hypothetical protein